MRRFWTGMMAGMLIGAAVGIIWLAPSVSEATRERWLETGRELTGRARALVKRTRGRLEDAVEEAAH